MGRRLDGSSFGSARASPVAHPNAKTIGRFGHGLAGATVLNAAGRNATLDEAPVFTPPHRQSP
jgi:hypothetical protein